MVVVTCFQILRQHLSGRLLSNTRYLGRNSNPASLEYKVLMPTPSSELRFHRECVLALELPSRRMVPVQPLLMLAHYPRRQHEHSQDK